MDQQHIRVTKAVGQSSRRADINAMGRDWADKNRAMNKHSSHEKALGNVLKGKNIEGKPSKGNFKKDPRKAPKSERMKNGLDNYYV